jgi:hypothetical protein
MPPPSSAPSPPRARPAGRLPPVPPAPEKGRATAGRVDGGVPAVQTGKADVLKGTNPADRESGATPGELGAEEYRELVDEYFKQLTRP